jgi:hypothetical protein
MRGNPAPSTTDHEYSLVEGGGRVGYADSVSKRPDEIRRVNHGVEEAEQGTAFDEVGSAEGLHFSDGLHERLGGGPTDAEKFFNVHAAPGFGPCVSGALPDGVQFSSRDHLTGRPIENLSFPAFSGYRDYWHTCQKPSLRVHEITNDNVPCQG